VQPPFRIEEVTVAVVLALTKELRGAEVMLADSSDVDDSWGSQFGFYCVVCRIPSSLPGKPPRTVVLAQPSQTGNNHAAICVAQLASVFKGLEAVICCGVAGGAPTLGDPERDVYLGDIVIANGDGVLQYDFGHELRAAGTISSLFDARREPRAPAAEFLSILNGLMMLSARGNPPWVQRLEARLPLLTRIDARFARPPHDDVGCQYERVDADRIETVVRIPPYASPKLFPGAIGSANRVLKNPRERDRLRDGKPRILAVEMEGAGIADACHSFGLPFTIVRGICDFCDGHKHDGWQFYAAAGAAACVYSIIERLPPSTRRTLVQVTAGAVVGDVSMIERVGVQAVSAQANSASSTVTIVERAAMAQPDRPLVERPQVASAVPTPAVAAPNAVAQPSDSIQVRLAAMRLAEANREWATLFKEAQALEALVATCGDVHKSTRADAIYEVARAYISWSGRGPSELKQGLRARANELMLLAQELL
jgi:nucleoside phosphorylase